MIKKITEIPGPKSNEWLARRKQAVARGPYHSTTVFVQRGMGSYVEDVDGNQLLDFGTGIAVNSLGHGFTPVVEAARTQSQKFLHLNFNTNPYAGYVEVCESLNELTPGAFAKKSFLANSGAEAVENAVKIARAYTKRPSVISFDHAFHGRTYMAMGLTAKAVFRQGFAPLPAETYRAPFPYAYRIDPSEAFAALESLVHNHIGANQVAAVIIEPILGEGGFVAAPAEYMKKLRALCTQIGAVLIADEIQSGFGRTGKLFALEHCGIEADLMTLAKGMGGGLPISAVVGRAEIMDSVAEGGIGGTYGGNPVACASALAAIQEMKSPRFLENASQLGFFMRETLERFKNRFECIGEFRGLGPMMAVEFVKDRQTKEPDKEAAQFVAKECLKNGLIILTCGTFGNVVRLLPPLNLSPEEWKEGAAVMELALSAYKKPSASPSP